MTIPSWNTVEDPSGNTPELVLSNVVSYINNYNWTDSISVIWDSRFVLQSWNLVYISWEISWNNQNINLQLQVWTILSNSFSVTIKNVY